MRTIEYHSALGKFPIPSDSSSALASRRRDHLYLNILSSKMPSFRCTSYHSFGHFAHSYAGTSRSQRAWRFQRMRFTSEHSKCVSPDSSGIPDGAYSSVRRFNLGFMLGTRCIGGKHNHRWRSCVPFPSKCATSYASPYARRRYRTSDSRMRWSDGVMSTAINDAVKYPGL